MREIIMKFVDHYIVLGLPTGEEGIKLTERQITKAFKAKALEVHPDKRPDDQASAAHSDFQKLNNSYQCLMDVNKRQEFDAILLAHLRAQQQQQGRTQSFQEERKEDSSGKKRRNVEPDFQEKERKKRQTVGLKKMFEEKAKEFMQEVSMAMLKDLMQEFAEAAGSNSKPTKADPKQQFAEKFGGVKVIRLDRDFKPPVAKARVVKETFCCNCNTKLSPKPEVRKVQEIKSNTNPSGNPEVRKVEKTKSPGLEELFTRMVQIRD